METKYPTLKRPKRKLCYLSDKERTTKPWAGMLSLGDIDRMFDDLDPSEHEEDVALPPSPLLHIDDTEPNQIEVVASPAQQQEIHILEKPQRCQKSPQGCTSDSAMRSPSPGLDIELDLPFKAHKPVKTSSPIEGNRVMNGGDEVDNKKDRVVSPILFLCEDDDREEPKSEPLPTQKCNSEDLEIESPPSKVALIKTKLSCPKSKEERLSSKSHAVKEKASGISHKDELKRQIPAPRPQNTYSNELATTRKPEVATPKTKAENVPRQPLVKVSSQVEKSMTTFLQKLRDASQPTNSWKTVSPVKAPAPPEPEEDFLILEDDEPLWFSIPSRNPPNKRHSRTSSTDKDSQTDKGATDNSPETAQKEQESAQANGKLGSPVVSKIKKKIKGREKKKKITEPENHLDELCPPENLPVADVEEHEKFNKKQKQVKEVPSKESDKLEEKPHKEQPSEKMGKKAQKNNEVKKPKSVKNSEEKAKKNTTLKRGTKAMQGVKEAAYVAAGMGESQEQSSDHHGHPEDLGLLSDQEIRNSKVQTKKKKTEDKQKKQPVVSEESSSADGQIAGKRKRRQPGQWWKSSFEKTEETNVTERLPTVKKSKQKNTEPLNVAVPSPVKSKKDGELEQLNDTQAGPSSSQKTNKTREKKTKQSKNKNQERKTPRKTKASQEVFVETEAEQIEQQEDLDLDPLHSSPLVLPHRDHSSSSGNQAFQRVYHHLSNEKIFPTPASTSTQAFREQLEKTESEKRRRKPPGDWWTVNALSEDVGGICPLPHRQKLKPVKERKKTSKQIKPAGLGSPRNGNVAVASKAPGGAPGPSPKVKPASARKTVKRSLAPFMDIFASAIETPSKVSRRLTGPSNRQEVAVRDCTAQSKPEAEDLFRMDAGEFNSSSNFEVSQNSRRQSDNLLRAFKSGPSSMIELEEYEDNDNMILPSSRVSSVLSASDLCAPPLKPLILQPNDKANLSEWFRSLWSPTVDGGAEISPDHFDWYFYQGRAIGVQVDLNTGSICNGKILLGSYMKKPLWVDHSATTVFNLLTSSVNVVINGRESRFSPAQSFMVPCGHAYSIQNLSAQPAVLYFTRIFSESSD